MTEIRITVRCKNDQDHAKILKIDARLGIEYAEALCGLIDGSSRHYIHPPGDLSPIGKCGICHGKLAATVEEVETNDAKSKRKPSAA